MGFKSVFKGLKPILMAFLILVQKDQQNWNMCCGSGNFGNNFL
jgi:hypothetical protein